MKDNGVGPGIDLEHYFRLLMRQKWFLILPAVMGLLALGAFSLSLKNMYSSKATILVEPQSIPTQFMSSALPYGPETYVRSLVEQIKSRSRLEKVILDYNLYREMRSKLPMEEVVAQMREHIEIERRGQDTFSVSFTGDDPEIVQAVTNTLTDMFIQENLNFRLQRSAQNVAFLESQAQKFSQDVQAQEERIQQFKSQNLERLPEQRMATQTQLNAAQQRLQSNAEGLAGVRAKLAAVRERVSILSSQRSGGSVVYRGSGVRDVDPLEEEVRRARKELLQLQSTLSDRHPDVKIKQAQLESLEAALTARPVKQGVEVAQPTVRRANRSPELMRAQEEESIALAEIQRLADENIRLQDQIEMLNKRLEDTPKVELDISELTRGLAVLTDQADAFQRKATDASASLAMERGAQGSQFRAIDRASLPSRPVSPNRPILIAIGAVAGLSLGFLLVIGMDLLFRPFLDEQDLARFTGVQVLVSIPHVGPFPSEWQRFRGQVSNLLGYLLGSLPFGEEEYQPTGLKAPEMATTAPGLMDTPAVATAAAGGMGHASSAHPMEHQPPTNGWHAPVRGETATPATSTPRVDYRTAPPITRAAPRGYQEAPVGSSNDRQGNGRLVYSSQTQGEQSGYRDVHARPVANGAPTVVVLPKNTTTSSTGQLVASERDTMPKPVIALEERSLQRTGSPSTAVVLGSQWGAPTRYLINSQPVGRRPVGADETMKELYRRVPWVDGKES